LTLTSSPKLLSKLTLERICPWFDQGSFQRGTDYWKAGHVRRVKATEDGVELAVQSSVSGRRRLVYHQEIEVYEYDGLIEVSGECSCPVSFNCKHVVAVLCDLIDRYSISASTGGIDQPVEDWLGLLSETTALGEQAEGGREPEKDSIQLKYLINPEPASVADSRFKIRASVFKSRVLKKGGYGKPVKHSFDRIGVAHFFDDFVLPADKLISSLVGRQTSYVNQSSSRLLEGELAELALQKMLQSGRCYWRDFDAEALQPAAERTLTFSWQEEQEGSMLQAQVTPPASHIFRVDRFWYVDTEAGQIGLLQYEELDAQQLALLLDAPFIPKKKLEDVSRHLILDTPAIKIPLPVDLDIKQITVNVQTPTIKLRLMGLDLDEIAEQQGQTNTARLSFQYGDIECPRPAARVRETHMEGNTAFIISRNAEFEQQAQELLRMQGLQLDDAPGADTMDWFCLTRSRAETRLVLV